MSEIGPALEAALAGGPERHHQKIAEQGKLPVRERVARLVDPGSFAEEALLANWEQEGLGADGVVTGHGHDRGGRVALMANDPTVKAGSWGPKTVEKILRIQERALALQVPMVYLVDSAGARITDQVQMFPGRRGAGRIFYNEVRLSGQVPQVCLLFGPSAAGGAYIPAFCDVVIMREGNASMYLGSPRMARDGDRREGDARGDGRREDAHRRLRLRPLPGQERRGGDRPRPALPLLHAGELARGSRPPPRRPSRRRARRSPRSSRPTRTGPSTSRADRLAARRRLASSGPRALGEGADRRLRAARRPRVGIVANQPKYKGGVLFVDSADKAARFIWTCNAFNVPLLFLADVPGFMIGKAVERQGIIRHGAKMISAVSEATVPKISVIVRKAYGAGLYAMAGPAFEPDCCIALPQRSIAVMGPQAAINAVFFNQIQAIEDEAERERFVAEKREEYSEDIDILHLASELVVDAVIEPDELRGELVRRFALAASKDRAFAERRNPVTPA